MPASSVYKLSAGAYMKALFPRYMRSRWYLFAVVVVPFVALSFVDINFVYVALMALFLIVPMMLGYVYFYYAFSDDCVSSIRKCRVDTTEEGLCRRYYDDSDEEVGEQLERWDSFASAELSGEALLLYRKKKKFVFQMIPESAFPNVSDFEEFVKVSMTRIEAHNQR